MMRAFSLKELSLDNYSQWPFPIKITSAFLVFLLVFFSGFYFIINPQFAEHDALLNQQKTLKEDFEKKQAQAANLPAYKTQLHIITQRFGMIIKQLPAKDEMAALLENMSKTGTSTGLSFTSFEPLAEINHDFYIELPIDIKVLGSYHQFALFLSRVVQMSRIVTLHDFTIIPIKNDADKKSTGETLEMSLIIKIYRSANEGAKKK